MPEPTINLIQAKSILRKYKKLDSWFGCRYGMNLYRGCTHNCVYCDGRAEKYQVEGEFGCQVAVKTNALELLQKELDPSRKRKPFANGFILPGGGVGDSYQPAEEQFELTRKTLELMLQFGHPTHLLTKSCLIERDIDLIQQIHQKNHAIVSMSFSSVDDDVSAIFEPGVSALSQRLQTLQKFKNVGLPVGMFLMPIIPFISDKPELIQTAVKAAKDIGVDFMLFGGMTLKPGRQKEYFLQTIQKHYPEFELEFLNIYPDSEWGSPRRDYYQSLSSVFHKIAAHYEMPVRIPLHLYPKLDQNEQIMVMLEAMDYYVKAKGQRSQFGYAAYAISQLKEPITDHREKIEQINGVGKHTATIIREILDTGESKFLRWLEKNKYNYLEP